MINWLVGFSQFDRRQLKIHLLVCFEKLVPVLLHIFVFGPTIWLWNERNSRLHSNSFRSVDSLFTIIDRQIRNRIQGFRSSNPTLSTTMMQAWFRYAWSAIHSPSFLLHWVLRTLKDVIHHRRVWTFQLLLGCLDRTIDRFGVDSRGCFYKSKTFVSNLKKNKNVKDLSCKKHRKSP